ncbi:DUF2277 family protein [Brevibacillus fluminis]|uniref:DUF2277 family protein n=1 Tax=Brevibacillus fluminis TaxID=511487 RepID=A0A3M8DN57_9BACL|nr:DUF2277 family protein [Brevibacillus fluminis]RNB89520.1 DUF2277 family protein [Brevibacillus fluminis]
MHWQKWAERHDLSVHKKTNSRWSATKGAFNHAIDEVAMVARNLLDSMVTNSEPRNREVEIEHARI